MRARVLSLLVLFATAVASISSAAMPCCPPDQDCCGEEAPGCGALPGDACSFLAATDPAAVPAPIVVPALTVSVPVIDDDASARPRISLTASHPTPPPRFLLGTILRN